MRRSEKPDLVVRDLTVRFGGLVAVKGVSFEAPAGRITGLIGPNGAGKTTAQSACAGAVTAAAGTVTLGGRSLDRLRPWQRASAGLGRTFQRMELFDSLTVRENVELGREGRLAGRHRWGLLVGTRKDSQEARARAAEALGLCGIERLAQRSAGDLSTGQRRMVELARAIASDFEFLMLDEPSSGLDSSESEHFGEILLQFRERTGIGILLVEHDMSLVSSVCEYLYVLDFGELIASGPTATVLSSEVVRSAYLGSETVEAARGAEGSSDMEKVADRA